MCGCVDLVQIHNNIKYADELEWNHVSACILNGGSVRSSISERSSDGGSREGGGRRGGERGRERGRGSEEEGDPQESFHKQSVLTAAPCLQSVSSTTSRERIGDETLKGRY